MNSVNASKACRVEPIQYAFNPFPLRGKGTLGAEQKVRIKGTLGQGHT